MELFKLLGTIAIDNSEANSKIDSTSEKADSFSGKLKKGIKTASKWGTAIAGGATVAAGALMKVASKSASTADNIDKMSQKIGISRKAYQELDFICSQSGTSVDGLQAGMKTLTTQMTKAANGTKSSAEMFDKLGVSVTNADGSLKSQEDVMFDTLAALQGMENQTEKARLATQLFGKSGTDLMPLLNGAAGSIDEMKNQAHELGLIMSDESVDAGVEYTDAMDQMQRSVSAATAEMGAQLLPTMTSLIQLFIEKGIPVIQAIIEKVTNVVTWFTNLDGGTQKLILGFVAFLAAAGPLVSLITTITTVFGALNAVMLANPIGLVIAAIAALIAIGVLLYKNWDKIKEKAKKLFDYLKKVFQKAVDNFKKKIELIKTIFTKAITAIKNTAQKILNGIKTVFTNIFNGIKTVVSNVINGIKTTFSTGLNTVKKTVSNVLNGIKEKFKSIFDGIKNTVKGVIDKIKGFFKFNVSLPKIKLPHFSIKPKGWEIGDLLKGSIPKLGIDWYAKAMDNPMIMNKPTAFGVNANGQIMAGGERGSEVVSGTNTLMKMISTAVSSQNARLEEIMSNMLELQSRYMPQMSNMQVVMDSGAMVGQLAPGMDAALGKIAKRDGRGV